MTLKQIIEQTDTRAGRVFDLSIQALIVLSLACFCVETLPDLSRPMRVWPRVLEIVTVAIFTIEYGLRILVADKRLRFIFSFYGLVDLAAILPFYLSTSVDLRSIRVFRMLRLFRAFKLFRYSKAIRRFGYAFSEIKEELVVYLVATGLIIFVSSVGIYYFENPTQPEDFRSIFHCLWWAIVTLTTVGYGDVYPVTVGGKIFTAVILLVGLGVVAVPAGLLASALTKGVMSEENEKATEERDR
jgi:voltage-gated potassium channel